MSLLKRVLVTGATGKQGGAVISALTSSSRTPAFHIIALTRKRNSPRAQALAQKPNVSIVEGDLDDTPDIFSKIGSEPLHGVFSVQIPLKPKVEEAQGKALVDAAIAHGVKHFVYSSAERGGPAKSDTSGTQVPHFISKFNIENHLKAAAMQAPSKMDWTIIRPVAFMENLTPNFFGRAFATMWQLNGLDHRMQLVSTTDIGILAAEAFKAPDEYAGKAISFATDALTPREAGEIFRKVVGTEMPKTYDFAGRALKSLLRDQLGIMFDWMKSDGFGADPHEYTRRFTQMQNFETWLRRGSMWNKGGA